MYKEPLVSVNITTYNRANLLPRCIESVLNQSYRNLEIIVIDDCSTDNTIEIIKQFINKDARVKYIRHKENLHLAKARNTGVNNSSGEYIAFLDDDDEWIDNDKIEKQVAIFENSKNEKLAIVCSNVRNYSDEFKYKNIIIKKPKNIKSHILKRNGIIFTSTTMTKKSILIETGGFDNYLSRGIDSEFYRTCIWKFGYEVLFMNDITSGYHEYGNDRITLTNNKISIKRSIEAQWHIIRKYNIAFLIYPKSLIFRLLIILKAYFFLLFNNKK